MPIDIDALQGTAALPVKPNTNEHTLLSVLADHSDKAFTTSELSNLTGIPDSSVSKTLSRLVEKGVVRKVDGYWAVADDVVATRVASLVSLDAIEARYSDDAYGRSDEWTDELPDLGENA